MMTVKFFATTRRAMQSNFEKSIEVVMAKTKDTKEILKACKAKAVELFSEGERMPYTPFEISVYGIQVMQA